MKVIVKYLNGHLITYDDADDVDEQFETVDIYLTSGRCLELDKNKVKKVTAVYYTPAGEQTSQIYFNHKPLIKKEVKNNERNRKEHDHRRNSCRTCRRTYCRRSCSRS